MKRITTILLLLFTISLSGQNLISNIESHGNLQRYFLTEIEDKAFILTFDALDSIRIFEVKDDGYSLTSQHYVIGAYSQYYYRVFGSWLLLESTKDAFAINLLTGEEKVFVSEDQYIFNRWRAYQDFVVLRQSTQDFSETIYQLMDKELNAVDVDDWYRDMTKATDEFAIIEKREDETRIIYRGDISTHELWEVSRFNEGEYFAYDDNQILSIKNQKVDLVNVSDGSSEELYTLTFEPIRMYQNNFENFFVFTAYNFDEAVSVVYSKASKKVKIWPFHIDKFLAQSHPDKFIFDNSEVFDSAHIYDFETETIKTFHTTGVEQCIVIDDRYLLSRVLFDFYIHDIEMNTSTPVFGDFSLISTKDWTSIKKGNKAHIYVETIDERIDEMMTLDLSTYDFAPSNLPIVKRGLNSRTQIFRLGEDVIVGSEEHIFHVTDEVLIQLTQAPIIQSSYQPFAIRGNELFWAEDNDDLVHFYSFEDGEKSLEAIFGIGNSPIDPDNFWVRTFINGNNSVLIYGLQGFESKYILLNKETGDVLDVDNIPYSLINSAIYNKDYFYTMDDFLYAVDETGEIHIVDMPLAQLFYGGSAIFEDDLYVVGADGLYVIDGLEATKVLDHGGNVFGASFDIIAGHFAYSADDEGFILKDGVWYNWTQLEDVWYASFDEEYLQVVKSTGTNLTETQLFHIATNEYIDLPAEIKERRIVSRFSYFDKKYIISYVGSLPTYNVKIHEVSEDFTNVAEVHSFESVGRGLSAHFEEFGNEGFLYIGNKLFLMNEDLEFIPLEGVFGDTENVKAVEKDGYFYFIAFHPELGRQVWSVQAFSERVSVDDLKKISVKLYPNPTHQMLLIPEENDLVNGNYRILSISGQEVARGKVDGTEGIDVSLLEPGFYYLDYLNDENFTFTAPFVKQ